MTLQQLKYIIKIVECGSITEAARQLFITQPSLSTAVKELETELGIEIFYRTNKGISLSVDGTEFLSYARQIIEQTELMEQRYRGKKPAKQLCSVSTQHYAFAVNAFVDLLLTLDVDEYEFTLRETRTYEIIEDVKNLRSEIGIIYFSDFNEKVLHKLLKENHLVFNPLFEADPHVFISSNHPLAKNMSVTLEDLTDYPFLAFEQGEYNSFYFSEEILSTVARKKTIHVSDRATLFNLLIGLNGYTICTGVLSTDLNGENIISVPLITDERMRVGWIANEKARLSSIALDYISKLKRLITEYGYTVIENNASALN
ncbi:MULTISPECIES: LysR family transcriptional regulator [Dehalobacter]|uniref:LysR family transcriptional regulator n=1 Tax=Dehalobacter restrictus TaxID=55583 RepID=A0A857DFY4_9FIRM|nr:MULTISPECIES: LysR family transcriptional regulator [Dehalobacter]EQB22000.1 Transcriptional regulator, LysR family [Dehalobacter sp. UNSWDHB]QGZ99194.1 LysR family transcriptional regulator [Dehalobacter restrictus]